MALPSAPFDPAQSIFNGLSVIQLKLDSPHTGVTTTETTTDLLWNTHHLRVGDMLIYVSGTGFTGLTAGQSYYVVGIVNDNVFQLSATPGGEAIDFGESSDGVFQPMMVFEATQLDDDPEMEMKYLARAGFDGVVRNARAVRTKGNDKYTFGLDEVKRLLKIFGGTMYGRKSATATIWIPDVDDAAGKCALKSPVDFACVVSRDGKVTHGNSDFSKSTIKIESLAGTDLVWTADGDA